MRSPSSFVLALVVLIVFGGRAEAQQPAVRQIVNITGQLYLAQNNIHNTVFLVTPEGIILSDPLNRDFALWLKAEFAKRFNVPVRYVLYTHFHGDHASGGVVFADTAQFVGQRNMLAALAAPVGNPPLTPDAAKMDVNQDGGLERSEATGRLAALFDRFDYNRDNFVNGAELARGALGDPIDDVYPPTITFTEKYTATLGGKSVVMYAIGPAHSADLSVLHFPGERAVFNADLLQINRLPNTTYDPNIGAWLDALRFINSLDYEHALTGHEFWGTKKDAVTYLQYFEDLSKGVAAGIAAGRSLAEIQKTLSLDAYKGFKRWDTIRERAIAHVYATMQGTRPSSAGTR